MLERMLAVRLGSSRSLGEKCLNSRSIHNGDCHPIYDRAMGTTDKLVMTPAEGSKPDHHVYILHGPLTLGNLFTAQEALQSTASVLILDLAGVPYVDSAGVGALVQCFVSRKKQGRRLLLIAPSDMVQKLFKLTQVDSLLEVFPTLEAAQK